MSRYFFVIKNRDANIKIRFWATIQIYSDCQEFTNKYLNVLSCPKIYEWISKYIRTRNMARIRIRIIFEGHFVWIFKYLNIHAHHCLNCKTNGEKTYFFILLSFFGGEGGLDILLSQGIFCLLRRGERISREY